MPPEPSSASEPCTGCAAIRFLGSDSATARPDPVSFPVIAHGTASCLLPGDPFVGLHCEHLPTSTVVHDFEQRTMSGASGAYDALGMGPSARYTPISVITVLCVLTISISISYLHAVTFVRDIHMHIYVVTKLLMFYFWIKLTMKMPNFLTLLTLNNALSYLNPLENHLY